MVLRVEADPYVSAVVSAVKAQLSQDSTPQQHLEQEILGHWLGGWDWMSIESFLEDKGHNDKDIETAIEAAKAHVMTIQKSGPFSTVRSGQLIRLKNGIIGRVSQEATDQIHVRAFCPVLEADLVVDAEANLVDEEVTPKLFRAHCLRQATKAMLDEIDVADPVHIAELARKSAVSVYATVYNVYNALQCEAAEFNAQKDRLRAKASAAESKTVLQSVSSVLDNQTLGFYKVFDALAQMDGSLSDLHVVAGQNAEVRALIFNDMLEELLDPMMYVSAGLHSLYGSNNSLEVTLDAFSRGAASAADVVSHAVLTQAKCDEFLDAWDSTHSTKVVGCFSKIRDMISKAKLNQVAVATKSLFK